MAKVGYAIQSNIPATFCSIAALITKDEEHQALSGCTGNICDTCGISYPKEGDKETEPEQALGK